MLKEFREFILKGNMLDMAVGIIIGAAFGTVVKSLVANVIMPPIGQLLNGVDFSKLKLVIGSKEVGGGVEEVAIGYGLFINDLITLVIVGFCVFLLVKFYNQARKRFEQQKEATPAPTPAPSGEVLLLTEIRDLLKQKE
jgi:large conductance mechanosensitive channel